MSATTVRRRGRGRELAVADHLRDEGWIVFRATTSVADLVALRDGNRPRLIEVKSTSTRGPWNDFGPEARMRLRSLARAAGADAWLVWWPLRGECRWIPADKWPLP